MALFLILVNIIFIGFSFQGLYHIYNDCKLRLRCTEEISVEAREVLRRVVNSKSEYWTSYKVLNKPLDDYVVSWTTFHPYAEGQKGVLYLNPSNINEFTYTDILMLKKNLPNIIPIISEIFIFLATFLF